MKDGRKLELLAPAGDFDKLVTAIHYGADAVYLAGERFGMRKASKNFDEKTLRRAVQYAHERDVKIHVTLNIVPHDEDLDGLLAYLQFLEDAGVDAVIVSDLGILEMVRENTNLEIHVSTQASATNAPTLEVYRKLGATRVVLARELSLKEIQSIRKNISPDLDLEVFVHGAMCISYSGRCLLSNYMAGRDANQGDCAQACRWKYHIVEEHRPGEYFPIGEEDGGTFIMNSKDLCLLDELPDLIDAGVTSFKVEGRVKTPYYVATVIRSYRQALDAIEEGRFDDALKKSLHEEIQKASYRDFTKGFFYGKPNADAQNYESSAYIRNYDFIGQIVGKASERIAEVDVRNKFEVGDELEHFGRGPAVNTFCVDAIQREDGVSIAVANVPKSIVQIEMPSDFEVGDMLRMKSASV